MFECVARPRYIPGHGWVTLENADTADLGAEARQALAQAREHARALAQLHKSTQHHVDTTTQAAARDTQDAHDTRDDRAGAPAFAPTPA